MVAVAGQAKSNREDLGRCSIQRIRPKVLCVPLRSKGTGRSSASAGAYGGEHGSKINFAPLAFARAMEAWMLLR